MVRCTCLLLQVQVQRIVFFVQAKNLPTSVDLTS